jgi:hypothetical protein
MVPVVRRLPFNESLGYRSRFQLSSKGDRLSQIKKNAITLALLVRSLSSCGLNFRIVIALTLGCAIANHNKELHQKSTIF